MDIQRDWGWSPEYVEAMWLILQQEIPNDFIIATGQSYSLQEFIRIAFESLDLYWQDYVIFNPAFSRPTDLKISKADPSRANRLLNWKAKYSMPEVVKMMIKAQY